VAKDLQITIDLSFRDSIFGIEKEIEVLRLETCVDCHGTKMKDGKEAPRCTTAAARVRSGAFSRRSWASS
jgi:molecular chaperone DnaJ